jgi:glycosyltransferase involved in cell wall biosynthesis
VSELGTSRVKSQEGGDVAFSVVIPAYRSAEILPELISRLEAVMTRLGEPFEIVIVHDCSPDNETWPTIVSLARTRPHLRGINLLYNVGQFRALLCGFEHARGRYIITMDDDLQHPPEEVPKLVAAIRAHPGLDCVMGRYAEKKHSLFRRLGSGLFGLIERVVYNRPAGLKSTSFRIMTRSLIETLLNYRTQIPQISPMVLSSTQRIINVTVEHQERYQGASGYSLWSLMYHTVYSVINASTIPLRFFSALGFIISFFSFLFSVFYFFRWLFGRVVPGFTSLVLLNFFFGGMVLLGIGIIGEYIARVIRELTGPPKYVVSETTEMGQLPSVASDNHV